MKEKIEKWNNFNWWWNLFNFMLKLMDQHNVYCFCSMDLLIIGWTRVYIKQRINELRIDITKEIIKYLMFFFIKVDKIVFNLLSIDINETNNFWCHWFWKEMEKILHYWNFFLTFLFQNFISFILKHNFINFFY